VNLHLVLPSSSVVPASKPSSINSTSRASSGRSKAHGRSRCGGALSWLRSRGRLTANRVLLLLTSRDLSWRSRYCCRRSSGSCGFRAGSCSDGCSRVWILADRIAACHNLKFASLLMQREGNAPALCLKAREQIIHVLSGEEGCTFAS
jgi:hypothetical protein